jgi:signal transduction histidine kinase
MRRRVLLFVAMFVAVALVAVVLWIDAAREGAAAVDDFAHDQEALASALVVSHAPLSAAKTPGPSVVIVRSQDGALAKADGTPVDSPPLAAAMARGDATVRLSRPEAAALGLPTRMAVAGMAKSDDGRTVAVVATAYRARDREARAKNHVVLGVAIAALLVFLFGGIALRLQRRENALERALLLREAERAGEERLTHANKLATMGAFATGIAHEIATPLGVIAARAEMLAPRVSSDERGSRALQAIAEQVEKIRGIIKSFLSMSRGEGSAQARIDARDVLGSATRMVEHRFGKTHVSLDVEAPDHATWVFADTRLLEQALVNLLVNACDASPQHGTVTASLRETDGRVVFTVVDEGPGIEPAVAARATEPFFTTKPIGEGTGLGLAIANEIAKHHQGRFVIGPRVGRGTEARLDLPSADAPKKERAA